jgi:hypothetical protein
MNTNIIEEPTDFDLFNHQFPIDVLEKGVENYKFSLRSLLRTQILTADFCAKYMLSDDKYAWNVEETYIDLSNVLSYQKHLTLQDLHNALKN